MIVSSKVKDMAKETSDILSIKDFAELAQKGALFPQIDALWGKLLGCSIEEVIQSSEFKKEGICRLIKLAQEGAAEGEEKKSLISRLTFLKENNEKLVSLLDPKKKRPEKIRHSGHFIDQKLKYEYPKHAQITIFDIIQSEPLKTKIEKYEFEVKSVGIRLSPPEDRLLNALQKLLHQKSQNYKPNSSDYYKGNLAANIILFGKEKKESPRIRLKPGELYRAYLDNDRYSGVDIKLIRETLMNLSAKKFLMKFDRKRQVEKNGKIQTLTDRIEEFQSLIHVIKYTEGIEESELNEINSGNDSVFDSRGELIIALNPILIEQINSKYIEYPSDINKRMLIAAGHHRRVTEAVILLRDYMLRELSSKRTTIEINQDRLAHQLQLHNFIAARQKKRVEKKVEDAINVVKNLGLLTDVKLVEGSGGQLKYIFSLNPNFE